MMPFLAVVLFLLLSFSVEVSSITQFHTHERCNASFVCYHSFNTPVNWNSSQGPLQQGPRLVIENTSYYSVLNLISVTPADNGNISCERNQSEALYFSLTVQGYVECRDIFNTITCKGTVDGGDDCTSQWMRTNCKKSCGLCPKYNCTESEQPTVPPTVPSTTASSTPVPSTTMTTSSEFPTNSTTNKTEVNDNDASSPRSNIFIVVLLGNFLVTLILSQFS